jgi:DNA replication protein DnaC
VGHPDFGDPIPCVCTQAKVVRSLPARCGLTSDEQARRLADFDTEGRPGTALMVQACREFLEHPVGMLTLWGEPGNGKTLALQALVNELVAAGKPAVYLTAFRLLSYVRQAFSEQKTDGPRDAYRRLMNFADVRVLAIDEFEKVNPTLWVREQLTELIDTRYRLGMDGRAGTVIAMNSDPRLQEHWIASRLLHGRNRVVHNTDTDLRPALA